MRSERGIAVSEGQRPVRAGRQSGAASSLRISVIIPALNEERFIGSMLESLHAQEHPPAETIVVDGQSRDATLSVARRLGARTFCLPSIREHPAINYGAHVAIGDVLLFTGADTVLPPGVLSRIAALFSGDSDLLAVAGPGVPLGASLSLRLEFSVYNVARFLVSRLPKPLKRFSTSTNLLAVRRDVFLELGGLGSDPINADGRLGAELCRAGKVYFSFRGVRCYISDRRMREMGFIHFNLHYLYVLENFLPSLSRSHWMNRLKHNAGHVHSRQDEHGSAKREVVN